MSDRYNQSDWDESSEDEEEKPKPAPVAAPKKKGTLKAKLAEKAAIKATKDNNDDDTTEYDEDAVLDPREKARRDKERELNADLNNAAELFGAAALGGRHCQFITGVVLLIATIKQELPRKSLTLSYPHNHGLRKISSISPTESLNTLSSGIRLNLYIRLSLSIL